MIRCDDRGVLLACVLLAASGCGEADVSTGPVRPRPVASSRPKPGGPRSGHVAPERGGANEADADAGVGGDASTLFALREEDFVEDDVRNRDPFRSYAHLFKVVAPKVVQRRVLMPDVTIDQMRVVAIVTRLPRPRAMLVDPEGVGHVVRRGDYLGRAEIVRTGGADGMAVTLNWRVERIREGEVVLTREDPASPDRVPLRRVLPLHEEEERPLALR